MNIAIVHDWLDTFTGAEKVLKALLELYPDADLFTLVDVMDDADRRSLLDGKKVQTSFLQHMPFSKKYFRNYLPLFPKAIESFNLNKYDLIISSSWAVAKGVKTNTDQLHVCYCHTPIRYAWDMYDDYTSTLKQPKKLAARLALAYLRKWDIQTLNRTNYFVTNSQFVKERIGRIYNRGATVIYPPVNTKSFVCRTKKESFYLTASRLVPYKKTKLIVEAFNMMPEKELIVVGAGEEYETIKRLAKPNVQVIGYQEDSILIDLMQRARAFVYAAVEDFGIVPIEAHSCGTPVIALDEGGTAETVIDGLNGTHFSKQEASSIVDAVQRFEMMTFDAVTVAKTAQRYDVEHFKTKFEAFVDAKV